MQVIHGRYDHFENKLKIQVANYERYASHIFVVKLSLANLNGKKIY